MLLKSLLFTATSIEVKLKQALSALFLIKVTLSGIV